LKDILSFPRKPQETQDFKLNLDKASELNPGRYGREGVIRDRNGNMKVFSYIYNGIATNNQAE
jgi:hypothetical protein